MKLHLPVRLFKSVLACLTAVASFSLGSGVAWAEAQNLTFSGSSLIWDTRAENNPFVDEEDAAASFAAGDNVSFTGESTVTLGENITAGTLDIAAGADVTIDLGNYTLHTDTISLSGTLAVGNSLSIASGSTLAVKNAAAVLDSALVLGEKSGLVVESAASLNSHTLTLQGGSNLILTAAGDGKTYTLFSGISSLVDKTGNTLTAGSYSINDYFDKSAPGSGFWADATLVLTVDGTLQLVRHNEMVKESLEIAERQTGTQDYSYYKSILFNDISSSSDGGAIYGYTITQSNNGSVEFSGNSAYFGGAIYGSSSSTITLNNNGSVTFSGNTASGSSSAYGGVIYGDSNSTITLSDNGSVEFSGNSASGSSSAYGGAIYGGSSSTITLSDNESVTFSGNTASSSDYSAYGGAIYGGSSSTITLSDNGSVVFVGNTASSSPSSSYAGGGAIYGYGKSKISLSNNGSVTFSGNSAKASNGGAIYGSVTLSNNDSVTFSGNTASASSACGGAIYGVQGSTITLTGNDSVTFSGNTASLYGGAIYGYSSSTISLSDNGSVTFSGNTASSSGGAIYGYTIKLSNNGSVVFEGNTASSACGAIYGYTITLSNNGSVVFEGNTASASSACGGAIYGVQGSTITLTGNDSVTFSGNTASSYGGAIYTYHGSLRIRNNDSVEFAGNVEKRGSTYRLRSVYVYGGSDAVLSISAAAGKKVAFYDSIYVDSDATVNLNAANADAAGHIIKQQGDIIFTGATTVDDLYTVKGNVAGTEEEIRLSRTTVVNTLTNLYGGRLRVEEGAIYQGRGITAHAGSEATVLVKDATLSHEGYDLTFYAGTTLELAGNNTITGNVRMLEGSSLLFDLSQYQGVTIHSGSWNVADETLVCVALDSSGWTGEWGEIKTIALLNTNANLSASRFDLSISPLTGNWEHSGLQWVDGTLSIAFKNGATNAEWTNAAGDFRWNNESYNWTDSGCSFARVNGADVTFGKSAEGSILLDGQMEVGKMTVSADAVYALDFATGASLTVQKDLVLGAGSDLTVHGNLAAAGVNGQGNLVVDGELNVTNAVTASSIQAGSLLADSLNLTNAENRGSITGDATVAGEVVAAGHLNVGGTLTASSLQAASLETAGLTLTDSSTASQVTGAVQVSGQVQTAADLTVGGAMSAQQVRVDGALTAASLQTEALEAAFLTLTDGAASNRIGSSVAMTGAVESAGSLTVEGTLTAASLQAASLESAGLTLTDSSTASQVTGAVQVSGQVQTAADMTVGGAMSAQQVRVDGALTAASLQTEALEAASLTLTDGAASNRIGSSVSMTGAVESASSLTVEGTLTAAELTAGGALSAQQVSVAGALTAASLQTEALEATSLKLTDATASNRIGSSVAMTGAVESAGSLTVEGALTAASVQTGALEVGSLVLTAGNVNTVTGNLTADSVSLVAGSSLTVDGVLTTDEVQMSGTALTLTAGSFGASTMNFELDRAALESLGLGYKQTGTIAQVSSALASGFVATLNGGADEVLAGAYKYTLSASGSSVQVTADYAFDGMQVWYRGAWVGKTDWSDFYVGGYDAVDGVESIDLSGETVEGANLFVAYEEGVTSAVVTNGSLLFDYVDLGGGQFEIGTDASVITSELYGKGETLVLHDGAELNATELTLGTLVLNDSDVTVKKAAINAITGTEGTLAIETGGSVTVKSDVILTGLTNEGSLNLGKKTLTVNALVDVGGNVTAGEVSVQSRGSRMAEFNKLVADKVTVVNSLTTGRYTDDLSVGDGSAIGELEAETLEVRGGTVTLGRSSGGTEMSLLNLDLQEDATLVLNQQTALAVTDTLTATENATVQLKQDASLSYGEVYLTNKKSDSVASVNASGLSGEADLQVQNAHVVAQTADATIDYQLVNSTVENAAGGTLKVTHENNTLNGVYATGGNVEVYNVSAPMSLEELRIATGLSVSLMTCAPETTFTPENEAAVTVVGLAVFEKGATLNANLTLAAGSELRMEGPLHMGSTLELVSGADSITLSGSMLDAVMHLGECESYTLFTGVDALTLTFDGNSVTYQPGTLNEGHKVLASTYFSNFVGTAQEDSLYITFNIGEVGGGELAFYQAPEPATATLSLLALAALAARRRRK